jgi:hypothetical protein
MNRSFDTETRGRAPGALDFAAVRNEWGEATRSACCGTSGQRNFREKSSG